MRLGLQSRLLAEAGFAHAFFMRNGGVSGEPFRSLNFSTAGGDAPEAVRENLARAARELAIAPERLYHLSQVHGTAARVLAGDEDREAILRERGDITLSRAAGVGCGVRMADCAAVLVADAESGAVAAVHSGWRGTVQGAAAAGVAALRALTGRPGRLLAAVGPHIERCCFEVGHDVAEQIAGACQADPESLIERREPRPHVDLRAVIEAQLTAAGVSAVDHVRGCTVCDPERFHSYRRDGKVGGRMLAAIVAQG